AGDELRNAASLRPRRAENERPRRRAHQHCFPRKTLSVTELSATDIEVTAGLAGALLKEQVPELAAAPVELLGEGWDNAAFLVDSRYVFRFPRRSVAAPLLAREIAILPLLAPHLPVAVSAPAFVGTPSGDYPWPFAGYRAFEGRPLS